MSQSNQLDIHTYLNYHLLQYIPFIHNIVVFYYPNPCTTYPKLDHLFITTKATMPSRGKYTALSSTERALPTGMILKYFWKQTETSIAVSYSTVVTDHFTRSIWLNAHGAIVGVLFGSLWAKSCVWIWDYISFSLTSSPSSIVLWRCYIICGKKYLFEGW